MDKFERDKAITQLVNFFHDHHENTFPILQAMR